MDPRYQNPLQQTDLWDHNIPTLEEYRQWFTKPVCSAFEMLFNPNARFDSGLFKFTAPAFGPAYEFDLAAASRSIVPTAPDVGDIRPRVHVTFETALACS